MNRRDFLAGLTAFAVLPSRADGRPPRRVGILFRDEITANRRKIWIKPFKETLQELGLTEGKDVVYEERYATRAQEAPKGETMPAREARRARELSDLVIEARRLLTWNPDVIWVGPTIAAQAAMQVTKTIPIVGTTMSSSLKELKLVESMDRPGVNLTGVHNVGPEMGAKRLQILLEAAPKLDRLGVVVSSAEASTARELDSIRKAASGRVRIFDVDIGEKGAEQVESAFAHLKQSAVQAVLMPHIPMKEAEAAKLMAVARAHKLAVLAGRPIFVRYGALASYNTALKDHIEKAATIVHKMLVKPGDVGVTPIVEPKVYELWFNEKAAHQLGWAIPALWRYRKGQDIELLTAQHTDTRLTTA